MRPLPRCVSGRTALGDRQRRTTTTECRAAWRAYDVAYAGIGDAVQPAPIPFVPMYVDPLNALGPAGGPDLQEFIASLRSAINANASKNAVYHLEIGNNGYVGYEPQYDACNLRPASSGPFANVSLHPPPRVQTNVSFLRRTTPTAFLPRATQSST